MKGFTVAQKIVFSFMVLILLFVGFGGYAIYSARSLNRSLTDLMDRAKNVVVVGEIFDAANEMKTLTLLKVEAVDEARWTEVNQRMAATEKQVEELFAAYEALLGDMAYYSEAERQEAKSFLDNEKKTWAEYIMTMRQIDDLVKEGNQKKSTDRKRHV